MDVFIFICISAVLFITVTMFLGLCCRLQNSRAMDTPIEQDAPYSPPEPDTAPVAKVVCNPDGDVCVAIKQ